MKHPTLILALHLTLITPGGAQDDLVPPTPYIIGNLYPLVVAVRGGESGKPVEGAAVRMLAPHGSLGGISASDDDDPRTPEWYKAVVGNFYSERKTDAIGHAVLFYHGLVRNHPFSARPQGSLSVEAEGFEKKVIELGGYEIPPPHLSEDHTSALVITVKLGRQGEQGGAGEPATRSESDSEGDDKPQPESAGRSR